MQILLTLLKSSRKRCHSFGSLRRQLVDPVDFKTPKRLCMKILALATTGPNSPNGSNSLAIVERTSVGVGVF
ncbi:hypothetical protein TNCV_4508331 [Trichonephila clavipes]|nr:hypothetical protein TNCV_4508331 [Trichonephila clavipes]